MDDAVFEFFANPSNYRRAMLLKRAIAEFAEEVQECFLVRLHDAVRKELEHSELVQYAVYRDKRGSETYVGLRGATDRHMPGGDHKVVFGFETAKTLTGSDGAWIGVLWDESAPRAHKQGAFEEIAKHFRAPDCKDCDDGKQYLQYESVQTWPLLGGTVGLQPLIGESAERLAGEIARQLVRIAGAMGTLLSRQR